MQNLGLVYLDRLRGEWAENLEQAMAALQQALEVYNRTALPVEWTGTMQNLGFVYTNCETGMTEFQHTPDEYIGLPTGFLQAGAPCVISTLWAVSDFTTTMLMERFYQNHLQKEMKIPEALRQAQLWLGI
ncbi:MAG: CHAT domain-containing protein [bacterium]|nr:CHAT domain-containing protein [bacterium]